jgi:uncharacterized protein (DUF952 family)
MVAIYKICAADEWTLALRSGKYEGSDVDRHDGYIHFSTRDQVSETAAKHFSGRDRLVLVKVDADRLGNALRWEPSRAGALFPHLYAALDASTVAWVKELPDGEAREAALASSALDRPAHEEGWR